MSEKIVEGTEYEGNYEVGDSGTITVSVWIGDGNTGGILVELNGDVVKEGLDRLDDVELGEAPDLDGSKLVVYTSVDHVNPQSSRTSVSHALSGGSEDEKVIMKHSVSTPGEVVDYVATFHLEEAT